MRDLVRGQLSRSQTGIRFKDWGGGGEGGETLSILWLI